MEDMHATWAGRLTIRVNWRVVWEFLQQLAHSSEKAVLLLHSIQYRMSTNATNSSNHVYPRTHSPTVHSCVAPPKH